MIRTVYIVNHTHTDIGYTNRAPIIAAEQARHLHDALALCEKYRDAPEGERFIWTVESFWTVQQYAKFHDLHRLVALAREGLVALTGFTHQPLTQLCTLERLDGGNGTRAAICRDAPTTHRNRHAQRHRRRERESRTGHVPGRDEKSDSGRRRLAGHDPDCRFTAPVPSPLAGRQPDPDVSSGTRSRARPGDGHVTAAQYGFGVIYLLWPYGGTATDGEKAVVEGSTGPC